MREIAVPDLHGHRLPVWVVDFETYWDRAKPEEYSLGKMSTTMYVRDPRFHAHGAAVISPKGDAFWVTHDDLPGFFASVSWKDAGFLAHNTYFDGLVAYTHYGVCAGLYLDTQSLSYGEWGPGRRAGLEQVSRRLGREGKMEGRLNETEGIRVLSEAQEERLVPYALRDAEECRAAFEGIYYERGYPIDEVHVIDLSVRAFVNPILRLDPKPCDEEIEVEEKKLATLLTSSLLVGDQQELDPKAKGILAERGIEGLLSSPHGFAQLLLSRGVVPPMKPSPSDPEKLTYAFAKTDLELRALGEDSRVSDLVAARLGVKSSIRRDRAQRLLDYTDRGRLTLPVPIRYGAARTQRWGGMDGINLQNLPSNRDGGGVRLREAIHAPKGMRLVGVDAAQIEARYNAYTAGEEALLQIFRDHGDPYSDLASKLYSRPVSKYGPNAHLRPVGKAMELGLGYGMGVEHFYWAARSGALGEPVAIEMDEAAAAVNLYRQVRPCIVEQWGILQNILALMKHAYQQGDTKWRTQLGPWTFEPDRVLLPNSLYMHYRGIHSREGKRGERTVLDTVYFHGNDVTRIWGSKLCENLIQATCRAIIAWQALTVARRYRIVLLVHDEIVFVVPAAEAEEALAWALDVLRAPPPWAPELPLDAEGHVGETYADLK